MTAAAPTQQATKIVVQETLDESVFYAIDGVSYESVSIEDETGFATRIVFVVFTPQNGYDRGTVHRIPISRVISVIGDAE